MQQTAGELYDQLARLGQRMADCVTAGGKLLICGTGGSAADAQHFAAELIGRYRRERYSLPAIALTTDTSILTAIGNDYSFADVFSRQVQALASPQDIVIAISTSGSAPNVLAALKEGRDRRAYTVLLTGGKYGGALSGAAAPADEVVRVPSTDTARVQEAHAVIIHIWCEIIDRRAPAKGDQ
jgi:D-sedoheptulose 7-phosphate isomerase